MSRGLLVRADGDGRIGLGHLMRCLALAQAWKDARREPVWLAAAELPEGTRRRYEREGIPVLRVDRGPAALSHALRETGAAWAVLDGYELTLAEQRAAKEEGCGLLMVDDDGAAGTYVADLVVDANLFADAARYAGRAASTRLLLGPRYALLRREFTAGAGIGTEAGAGGVAAAAPEADPTGAGAPPVAAGTARPRLLVSFGGADPERLSERTLEALLGLRQELSVTLVIGAANPRREALLSAAAGRPGIDIRVDVSDMGALMREADIALVAAGSTCLELAHAGVPQIVVATAENQRRVASTLVARGVARGLGDAPDVTPDDLRAVTLSLAGDPAARQEMSARGKALVDGRGAERVVKAMGPPEG